jgi:hypothetical protein
MNTAILGQLIQLNAMPGLAILGERIPRLRSGRCIALDCFVAPAPRNDSTKHLRVIASAAKQSQRCGISPGIAVSA